MGWVYKVGVPWLGLLLQEGVVQRGGGQELIADKALDFYQGRAQAVTPR